MHGGFRLTGRDGSLIHCVGVHQLVDTALVYDDVFLKHETGAHPENRRRLEHSLELLSGHPVFSRITRVRPERATRDDLLLVHGDQHVDLILSMPQDEYTALDPDTLFGPGSLDAALYAAGGVISAVKGVTSGEYRAGFCMVRPPGHHATPRRAMGFCVFNNVALGAAYALERCGIDRVAIIDFDVHHGNGTQEAFYTDERVLYISLHQYPFYPGTGTAGETGLGRGAGKTLNIPLPAGSTEDVYLAAFRDCIVPAVEEHRPSLVLVSAGFDAHERDPIGGMRLVDESYGRITRVIMDLAWKSCSGRVVSALEGGYHLDALAGSICAHLSALAENTPQA